MTLNRTLALLAFALTVTPQAYAAQDTSSLAYFRAYPLADRGYKLIREQRYGEATELFERAVTLAPENKDYRAQLVDLLVREQRYSEAQHVVGEGLALEPNDEPLLARQRVIADITRPAAAPVTEISPAFIIKRTAVTPQKTHTIAAAKPAPIDSANGYYEQALQLQRTGDNAAAVPLLEKAYALKPDNYVYRVSLGYAYRNAKRNEEAIPLFQKALMQESSSMVREDMAWAMKEEGLREDAADALKGVLPDSKDANKHYGLRREIQQLEDNFQTAGSITYRDGLARSSGIPGLQSYDRSFQYGLESVYSPDDWQRNGRRVQLYGQAFASSNSGEFDFNDNTTQGAAGIRATPLANTEWYLYTARLFNIGSRALNDWQLRTTYAYTQGFDIDPNQESWPYIFVTPDVSYLTHREEIFATVEGRYGYSYRFGNNWVMTPHLVTAAAHNHNPRSGSNDSLEYGPGISMKLWFDETKDRAPRGSGELILQWREAVGPSEDKSGPFLRFVMQY